MTIREKKQAALAEILTAYINYSGNKSPAEECIRALRLADKLTTAESGKLLSALTDERRNVFDILAGSRRVQVEFTDTIPKTAAMNNNATAAPRERPNGNYPLSGLKDMLETSPLPDGLVIEDFPELDD